MKKAYIIDMINYQIDSGGTRTLHKLCHHLNNRGYDAYMNCMMINKEWNEKNIFRDRLKLGQLIREDAIVVYPEYFARRGNWILSRHPVGYQGGLFGEFGPEFNVIFSHLPTFQRKNSPQLFMNVIEFDMFNNKGTAERPYLTVWGGKGNTAGIEAINFTHYIAYNRDYPQFNHPVTIVKDRRQIAETLRKSYLLISFDSMSAVITEARLCGCPVTWIPNGGNWNGAVLCSEELWLKGNASFGTLNGIALKNTPEAIEKARETVNLFEAEYHDYCKREDADIENFIRITQAM
jgi:hypothetical protein